MQPHRWCTGQAGCECHATLTLVKCHVKLTYVADLINARTPAMLAIAVKALRRRRGLTQAELAAAAGVSRQWVVNLEANPAAGLDLGKLMAALDVLDASLWVRDDADATP